MRQKNRNGHVRVRHIHLVDVLSNLELNGNRKIRKDIFKDKIEININNGSWNILDDRDERFFLDHLCRNLNFDEITSAQLATACASVADLNIIDSGVELVKNLPPWDGVPRVEKFFSYYCKAEDTEYYKEAGKYMFTAIIARASCQLQNGIKTDIVPVLIGDQGTGKSTLCQLLALESQYALSANFDKYDLDELRMKLKGKIIVELNEMGGIKQHSVETIKSFISDTYDEYRKPYERHPSRYVRRCVFIGTSNRSFRLTDRTGNRRFAVLELGDIRSSLDEIANVMPQLWAEAKELYEKNGVMFSRLEKLAVEVNKKYSTREKLRLGNIT